MTITRWEAYRDVVALQNRMNSLFQDFSRNGSGENEPVTAAGFVPPVDIYEDEHKLVLNGKLDPVGEGRAQFRDGR
jgi:HSP20 family protein